MLARSGLAGNNPPGPIWCYFRHFTLELKQAKHKHGFFVNSEGFLAEVFHPWVRWEGPGSGFENSSGAAGGAGGGVWKSRIHRFGPLGIEVEKQGFRTAWLITGQKFP